MNCKFGSNQYALAIHTTSPQLGLALSNFAGDTRSQVWNLDRGMSTHLHLYLQEFLAPQTWTDLAFISVAKGPGSFTGTRIGVVTARTLAQQLNIPLFSISTLAAIVWSKKESLAKNTPIAIAMEARRGQLFGAIYEFTAAHRLTARLPDTVITPQLWQQTLDSIVVYQKVDVSSGQGATVTSVLELAYLEWKQGKQPQWFEALPFYGQHPVETE